MSMDNNSQNFTPTEPVAPTPTPMPSFEPEPAQPSPEVETPRKRKGSKILFIVLVLLAVAGIGYSVYAFTQNSSQAASLGDKDQQIKSLNSQIAVLKSDSATSVPTTTNSGNTIAIRELGISLTVSDSIKDLSYSYTSGGSMEDANFSTKTITDKYANTGSCSSSSSAPPLGTISKIDGQAKTPLTGQVLVKQFSLYYITYSAPQSDCVDTQSSVATEIQAFKDSFTTIKEL